jgi:lysozyme
MDRDKLRTQLVLHEGMKQFVYTDTLGIETIGVGRNLRDKGLSREEVYFLLDNDIDECLEDLQSLLPFFDDLDDVRQRVLLDMRFNLGPSKFRGFKNFLKAVKESRYKDAAAAMLNSKWAKQVKSRAKRLSTMMATGQG